MSKLMALLKSRSCLLFMGTFLLCMGASKGYIDSGDAQARYSVANNMWHKSTIFLDADDPWIQACEIKAFTPDGKGISFYGLGQSITMLPSVIIADLLSYTQAQEKRSEFRYLLAQFIFTMFFMPLLCAAALLAFYRILLKLDIEAKVAFWASIALGFGTFWQAYTKIVGMNIEVCLLIFCAILAYTHSTMRNWNYAICSLCFGLSFHYRQELLLPIALLYGCFLIHSIQNKYATKRYFVQMLWPCIICGLLVMWHNFVRSGNVYESFPDYMSYYNSGEENSSLAASAPLTEEAKMLGDYPGQFFVPALFSLQKGLIPYSPILAFSLLWLWPGARRWHQSFWVALLPFAAFTLLITSIRWVMFEGGWGPRYLLPIVPFLIIGVTYGIAPLLKNGQFAKIAVGIVIASCLFQTVATFEGNNYLLKQTQLTAEAAGVDSSYSYHHSLLVGRFRNLGYFPLDDQKISAFWQGPSVQAAASQNSDQLWWLKLSKKTSSTALQYALVFCGVIVLASGAFLVLLGGSTIKLFKFEPLQKQGCLA